MKTMKFRIGDIQPSPFRDLDRYPLRPDKIDARMESVRSTGFWQNIVARIREDGLPEIAHGHHRFWQLLCQRPKPRAEPSREQHRTHAAQSTEMTGLPPLGRVVSGRICQYVPT